MSNSTKKPFAEQLHSLTNVEGNNTNKENCSNEPLGTFEQIPFTPFFVIGDSEKGFAAVMGKFRITELMERKTDVIEYVSAQPYELLITIMSAVFQVLQESKGASILDTTTVPPIAKHGGYDHYKSNSGKLPDELAR